LGLHQPKKPLVWASLQPFKNPCSHLQPMEPFPWSPEEIPNIFYKCTSAIQNLFHPSVYISATYRYQYNIELAFEERWGVTMFPIFSLMKAISQTQYYHKHTPESRLVNI
jgi:hypothetical protein